MSKWERGEALPDVGILPDLADILDTSIDQILRGGDPVTGYRGRMKVEDIREGMQTLARLGELLGKENRIYRAAIEGINEKLNTDIEAAFMDDSVAECFVTEAILENIRLGYYFDLTDVQTHLQYPKFRDMVCDYARKFGMV